MKRKKLTEFINWFANSRRKYTQSSNCECIAAQVKHWIDPKSPHNADVWDLQHAFDLTMTQATGVFSARWTHMATRAAAVEMLRHLVRTGNVDWERAYRIVEGRKRVARHAR